MNNSYVIQWKSTVNGRAGRGTKRFDKDEAEKLVEELNRDIRRYAKKQIAYWKRNPDIKWFKPSQREKIEKLVRAWIRK